MDHSIGESGNEDPEYGDKKKKKKEEKKKKKNVDPLKSPQRATNKFLGGTRFPDCPRIIWKRGPQKRGSLFFSTLGPMSLQILPIYSPWI